MAFILLPKLIQAYIDCWLTYISNRIQKTYYSFYSKSNVFEKVSMLNTISNVKIAKIDISFLAICQNIGWHNGLFNNNSSTQFELNLL